MAWNYETTSESCLLLLLPAQCPAAGSGAELDVKFRNCLKGGLKDKAALLLLSLSLLLLLLPSPLSFVYINRLRACVNTVSDCRHFAKKQRQLASQIARIV